MENSFQTNLLDAFQRIERLLPNYARTGIFSQDAQRYTRRNNTTYRPLATIAGRQQETTDTISLLLQPPAGYPAFRAGQHIDLAVQIQGVRHARPYSITSEPGDTLLRVTVKRQEHGLVSNYLHDHAKVPGMIEISAPKGAFVLPAEKAQSYVFCSAGSGITPVYAMVRQLLASGSPATLHFFHAARKEESVIFRAELEHLSDRHAQFMPHFFLGEGTGVERRRLNSGGVFPLLGSVTDPAHTAVFLCGPGDFVRELETGFREKGYRNISSEYYTLPSAGGSEEGTAHFIRSGLEAKVAANLLETAEAAGLKPKHGCRRGICHECKVHKKSGSVKNILTGQVTQGEENIQLCVSQAVGRVEVEI